MMKVIQRSSHFILLSAALLMLLSCVSTGPPKAKEEKAAPQEQAAVEEQRPVWIDEYPTDDAYFIGVGSSKTGNESGDRKKARATALSVLAATISTEIQSEGTFVAGQDKEGKGYETAEVMINESVNQNLKQVETVGTYYSQNSGAWHYARLSKEKWAAIQKAEMDQLRTRVLELVLPLLDNPGVDVASKLTVLWKGWDLVAASPYAGTIMSEMQGEKGSLLDLVEKRMGSLVNSLSVSVDPSLLVTEPGTSQKMTISIKSDAAAAPGQYDIDILTKDGSEPIVKVTSDQNGRFSGDVKLTESQVLLIGKTALVAKPGLIALGIRAGMMKSKLIVPEKDFMVDVQQIKVGLKVQSESQEKITGLDGSIKALFSKDLPFKISDKATGNRFVLVFTLTFRDMPANQFGMFITKTRAQISVEKEARTIHSYETEEFKETGLTKEQAKNRATLKLFDSLKKDADFVSGVAKVFR